MEKVVRGVKRKEEAGGMGTGVGSATRAGKKRGIKVEIGKREVMEAARAE